MSDLRIAVLGVGMMGADHVARITTRIPAPGSPSSTTTSPRRPSRSPPRFPVPGDRRSAGRHRRPEVDAVVLATPGPTHEKQLLACLEHGKPVMCEKPLTTDVATSLEVVKREAELGKRLIQVGFMRRFDHEYAQLKALIDAGELGRPLVHALRAPQPGGAAELRQLDDRQGLAGPRGRRDALPVRRGDHLGADRQADAESRLHREGFRTRRSRSSRPRGQARRRRGVRHHRRGLRGAHRGRRRARQRDDRSRRRTGPQERRRALGRRITPSFKERFGRPTTSRSSGGWTRCSNRRLHRRPEARGTATPPRRCARPVCESLETGQPVEVEMVDARRSRGLT